MVGAQAQGHPAPSETEVAPGVWLFQTPPYDEIGLDGNAVAILGTDGVAVVDSNGTPTAARHVIAAIARRTPLPVRAVINTHWHWDHWYGTEAYRAAFPSVPVIAQARTRTAMAGPAIAFNQPGLDTQLPEYIAMLDGRLSAMAPGPAADDLRARIARHRWFLAEKRAVRHVLPDVTYDTRHTVVLGDRTVELVHVDRAVSPGDTMVWLPKERLLIAGDVLVNPVSFALSAYPSGWIRTLEWIDGLDAAVIVPGHGAPMSDETRLHATLEVLRLMVRHGAEARDRGLDPFAAADELYPRLSTQMQVLVGHDRGQQAAFRTQLLEWGMHRVFEELAGPLTDAIAPIPVRREGIK
jgi:glyoxylase-like metal-dependent hydrolase (beta-lactamase superfamily II)